MSSYFAEIAPIRYQGPETDNPLALASLTGSTLPADRIYDSIDQSTTLLQGKPSPRKK